MLEDDNIYVVVSSDQLNQILKAFGHDEKIAKNASKVLSRAQMDDTIEFLMIINICIYSL